MTPKAYVLVGPTAVGKSSVAHLLAKRLSLPVISADSMAVYQGMDIGTAKPGRAEREEVEYHGLDLVAPDSDFSAADWLAALPRLPLCIVAGGTGLYVKALMAGFDSDNSRNDDLRAELDGTPVADLQARLKHVNPAWLERLDDPKNPRRLIRTIERALAGEQPPERGAPKQAVSALPAVHGLWREPDVLRERIRRRIEVMFAEGLVEEATELRNTYPIWSGTAEHAIGYKEALEFAAAEDGGTELFERVVTRTNRLAKRQRTWFKHQLAVEWIEVAHDEPAEAVADRVLAAWEASGPVALGGLDGEACVDPNASFTPRESVEPTPTAELVAEPVAPPEPPTERQPEVVRDGGSGKTRFTRSEETGPVEGEVREHRFAMGPNFPPPKVAPAKDRLAISDHKVKDVPSQYRPREMFERLGAGHVPDAVLMSILLRSGSQNANVIDLANDMLRRYGSLTALAEAPQSELEAFPGIGPVKAQILISAFELAKRLTVEKAPQRQVLNKPVEVAELLREEARTRETEVFWIFCLDPRNKLMRAPSIITTGIADATLVHPREVFKEAIRASSSAVILAHNHPSGDPSPSPADIRITRKLVQAGKVLSIEVMDHIVVGKENADGSPWFVSIRESGLVPFE